MNLNLWSDMLSKYRRIFLDFDGVICDSNEFKSANILSAARKFVTETEALTFERYFTGNNGVPRETKIASYFSDKDLAENILKDYNSLNSSLRDAPLAAGAKKFIVDNADQGLSVLSGGDLREISSFLQAHGLYNCFQSILTGPLTKSENLGRELFEKPALFIGDSLHDFEVARDFGLEFVFMWGYTRVVNWDSFPFPENVMKVKDFESLNLVV